MFSAIANSWEKSTTATALRMPSLRLPEPMMRAFSTVWLSSITVRGSSDCAPSCAVLPAPARTPPRFGFGLGLVMMGCAVLVLALHGIRALVLRGWGRLIRLLNTTDRVLPQCRTVSRGGRGVNRAYSQSTMIHSGNHSLNGGEYRRGASAIGNCSFSPPIPVLPIFLQSEPCTWLTACAAIYFHALLDIGFYPAHRRKLQFSATTPHVFGSD